MNSDSSKQLMTCFKYRSGPKALRCLSEGTLYFAAPNELNDTLEAKFDYASVEDFSRVMGQTYSEVSQKRGGPPLSFDSAALSDMSIANAAENEKLREFCDLVGIFSAARRPDHQAMWAYYAENCSGVCFELEWSPEVLQRHQLLAVEVTYTHLPRIHNRAEDWRAVFMELATEYPDATIEQLHHLSLEEPIRQKWGIYTASRATSSKHTDWAHESEVRLLAPRAGALPVLADVLKRVHFIRTDNDKWGETMQLLFTRYPLVEMVHWSFHHGMITATGREMEFRLVPA